MTDREIEEARKLVERAKARGWITDPPPEPELTDEQIAALKGLSVGKKKLLKQHLFKNYPKKVIAPISANWASES